MSVGAAGTTVRSAMRQTAATLREARIDTPQLDAELLLGHVLGLDRAQLRARGDDSLSAEQEAQLAGLVARRSGHEPVQYITGRAWFRRLELAVDQRVLIPRPETELLVEWALEAVGGDVENAAVLDLCTGSGAIALAIADEALPGRVEVTATDLSADALDVARGNLERTAPSAPVELVCGDLFEPLGDRRFDVIVSNPPYVPRSDEASLAPSVRDHEPHLALFVDSDDETHLVRRILDGAAGHMRPGALLAIEIGMGQHEAVRAAFEERGFSDVELRRDLQGIVRAVGGRCAVEGPR